MSDVVLASVFIIFGYVSVNDLANMLGTENLAVTIGKWAQFLTVVVGTVAAIGSLARPPKQRLVPTGRAAN